jgi:CSLREA domain-containing protein
LHVTSAARVRVFVVFVATLAAPSIGQAATFTVNSTLDAVDAAPGDGICATAGAVCMLRAAIQEAHALAGTDTIVVSNEFSGRRLTKVHLTADVRALSRR